MTVWIWILCLGDLCIGSLLPRVVVQGSMVAALKGEDYVEVFGSQGQEHSTQKGMK